MSWREQAYLGDVYAKSLTLGRNTSGNVVAHGGILAGAGTSSTYYTMAGASKSALSFYIATADTADSNRVAYMRLSLTGVAGGGEALRAFCTVATTNTASPAARGIHASVSVAGSGQVSGEAMAAKATLHVPNKALTGTVSALCAEVYTDGDSAAPPASHGIFRATVGPAANTTANALIKNFFYVDVPTACVGNLAAKLLVSNAEVTTASTAGLQVRVQGTQYWIPLHAIA